MNKCQIVPWFDRTEWLEVYNKIYSTPTITSKQEALEILSIWKTRCPSLPAGIESTLSVLDVHVQDLLNAVANEQLLRLAYSSAVMRFVNHMLDAETAKGTSLHHAARILGVPDWIIDLRHDTAHNNVLPSVEILREATSISLDWLQKNYWDKHKEFIEDFISGHNTNVGDMDDHKITMLMNFCASLSVCASSSCKIKNLSDIQDANMREAILADARDLFANTMDLSNLKTVSVASLINQLKSNAKEMFKSKDIFTLVNKALTNEDSLLLSIELLNFLSESEFNNRNKLRFQYIQCFEVLLTFLHSHDLLMSFILELIKITQEDTNDSQKRKLAALWVSEILQSLKKSMLFCDRVKRSDVDETKNKKKNELRQLFQHWFPNEKNDALLLDLQRTVPNEWTDMKFIQPILASYNPYLVYFVKDLLSLVEPSVPKENVEKIYKLAMLISSSQTSAETSSKIYTVDDLQLSGANYMLQKDPDSDCMEICEEEIPCNLVAEDQVHNSFWVKASQDHNWSMCPIGILPWQLHKYINVQDANKI